MFIRLNNYDASKNISSLEKLSILMSSNTGLNQNIYEHLQSLVSGFNLQIVPLFNDENKKMMVDLTLASVLDWYLTYIDVILKKNMDDERVNTVWYNELTFNDFNDMYVTVKLSGENVPRKQIFPIFC